MRHSDRHSALTPVRRAAWRAALLLACVLPMTSCTSTQKQGQSPAYLLIDSLRAASGAAPSEFGGTLASDVLTMVRATIDGVEVAVPTIFEDLGQVTFSLGLKDPGSAGAPNVPTTTNFITVTRYRVEYVRSDGRNTPGVDVPHPFDGAATVTVGASSATATIVLVRIQAKQEAPLKALTAGGAISTIARVTFYGHDQAGRAVSVTGQISVNFADWGDPS